MFYENYKLAYRLRGVYRVHLSAQTLQERCRLHTALSLRLQGCSTFCTGDETFSATDNTVMYFPAGVNYTRKTHGEEELIVIHLDTLGEEEKRLYAMSDCEKMRPLFEGLLHAWENEGYLHAMELFYGILKHILENASRCEGLPPVIARAYPYMQHHFADATLSISSLAKLCYVSEPYFRRAWHAHFGKSPLQTLLDIRFSYAEELLATSYYSVKEIAVLSGFGDEKYFRCAFKKRYGVTVREYLGRKKAKQ